jgi:ABC-type glycerol-3-phosphate transport system permease component
MHEVGSILLLILGAATVLVSPVAWVLTLVFACKAIANRKPGLALWRDAPAFNPCNHLISRNLTSEGLRYRRHMCVALLAFVLPIIATLALAALTRNLE